VESVWATDGMIVNKPPPSPPPPPPKKGHYIVAQVGRTYNAVEILEADIFETGYLAVKENEEVLLFKTKGSKGHSKNLHSWYLYAKNMSSNEYGWLPLEIVTGYFAFVASDYDAEEVNNGVSCALDLGYLPVTKGERILLIAQKDEEGHLIIDEEGQLIIVLEETYYYAKNVNKNECGWIPLGVISDYDKEMTF